jgi:hypothetical protein
MEERESRFTGPELHALVVAIGEGFHARGLLVPSLDGGGVVDKFRAAADAVDRAISRVLEERRGEAPR